MFVSFARQYRRVLFSRIPKPRYFTTVCTTGTYVPRDESYIGSMVHAGTWQWPLGKVNIHNDCIDDNATLSVGLDEGEVRVDMWLDFRDSEDDWLEPLHLKVELNDTNAEMRLSEFFHRVRSLKKINGKEYFDMTTDVRYYYCNYPCKLSTSAHTKLVSLELEIQQLIQNWDLRQLALELVSTCDAAMDYVYYDETRSYIIEAQWDADIGRSNIMDRYGIDEEECYSKADIMERYGIDEKECESFFLDYMAQRNWE